MRVLVIGGSGFIGKNFLLKSSNRWECFATYYTTINFPRFILSNNLTNTQSVYVNMTDPYSIKTMLKRIGNTFDICLYAMGNSDIGKSRRDPLDDMTSNVYPLLNLLQMTHIGKIIFISSGAVYEGYKGLVNPSLPINPTIPYAISKLTSERYIEHFQKNTDHLDNYICLRFFGAYGPMEPSRKIYNNLVRVFGIDQCNEYILQGDGKNYIDAMHIEDMINGIIKMIDSDKGNKILDYCFGKPLTINELVRYSAGVFGKDNIDINHKSISPEYTTFYASPLEVESLFGFRPQINLRQGLQKFKEYLCRN